MSTFINAIANAAVGYPDLSHIEDFEAALRSYQQAMLDYAVDAERALERGEPDSYYLEKGLCFYSSQYKYGLGWGSYDLWAIFTDLSPAAAEWNAKSMPYGPSQDRIKLAKAIAQEIESRISQG